MKGFNKEITCEQKFEYKIKPVIKIFKENHSGQKGEQIK
jgi:hypothetical protein